MFRALRAHTMNRVTRSYCLRSLVLWIFWTGGFGCHLDWGLGLSWLFLGLCRIKKNFGAALHSQKLLIYFALTVSFRYRGPLRGTIHSKILTIVAPILTIGVVMTEPEIRGCSPSQPGVLLATLTHRWPSTLDGQNLHHTQV